MAAEWFWKISGKELGPLSSLQLKAMAEKGRLKPEHPVRQGAEGAWVPAGRVKGLFAQEVSPAAVSDSTDVPVAKPLEKAAAKPGAKARPAPRRAVKPADLPVAQAAPQPPAASAVPRARATAAPPAASKPASTGAPAANPLGIVTEAGTPAARLTGRGGARTTSPRRKQKQKLITVALLGVLVVGLAVAGIVLIVVTNRSEESSKKPGEQAADAVKGDGKDELPEEPGEREPKPSDKPARSEWYDASKKSITRGDVTVKILSARVAVPRLVRPTGTPTRPKDKKAYLHVTIELRNANRTKKLEYKSWSTLGRSVSLTDNHGNPYFMKSYRGAVLEGQLESESIYPTEAIQDLLLFQAPVENAKYLRLELPARAFGKGEPLRFEIPKEMILTADEEPPQDPADGGDPADGEDSQSNDDGGRETPGPAPDTDKPGDGDKGPDNEEPSLEDDYPDLFPDRDKKD